MDNDTPQFELVRFIDVAAKGGSKPVSLPAAAPSSVAFSNAHGGLKKVTYAEAREMGANAGRALADAFKAAAV